MPWKLSDTKLKLSTAKSVFQHRKSAAWQCVCATFSSSLFLLTKSSWSICQWSKKVKTIKMFRMFVAWRQSCNRIVKSGANERDYYLIDIGAETFSHSTMAMINHSSESIIFTTIWTLIVWADSVRPVRGTRLIMCINADQPHCLISQVVRKSVKRMNRLTLSSFAADPTNRLAYRKYRTMVWRIDLRPWH